MMLHVDHRQSVLDLLAGARIEPCEIVASDVLGGNAIFGEKPIGRDEELPVIDSEIVFCEHRCLALESSDSGKIGRTPSSFVIRSGVELPDTRFERFPVVSVGCFAAAAPDFPVGVVEISDCSSDEIPAFDLSTGSEVLHFGEEAMESFGLSVELRSGMVTADGHRCGHRRRRNRGR